MAGMGLGALIGALALAFLVKGPDPKRMVLTGIGLGVGEIVLALYAWHQGSLIAAFLMIFFVVLPPSKVKFDGRTFNAANIDDYIYEKALVIKDEYQKPPKPKDPPQSVIGEFQMILEEAVAMEVDFRDILPAHADDDSTKQKYNLPRMIDIDNVAAELIRTVAYVPLREVSTDIPYSQEICEPNDIDVVIQ